MLWRSLVICIFLAVIGCRDSDGIDLELPKVPTTRITPVPLRTGSAADAAGIYEIFFHTGQWFAVERRKRPDPNAPGQMQLLELRPSGKVGDVLSRMEGLGFSSALPLNDRVLFWAQDVAYDWDGGFVFNSVRQEFDLASRKPHFFRDSQVDLQTADVDKAAELARNREEDREYFEDQLRFDPPRTWRAFGNGYRDPQLYVDLGAELWAIRPGKSPARLIRSSISPSSQRLTTVDSSGELLLGYAGKGSEVAEFLEAFGMPRASLECEGEIVGFVRVGQTGPRYRNDPPICLAADSSVSAFQIYGNRFVLAGSQKKQGVSEQRTWVLVREGNEERFAYVTLPKHSFPSALAVTSDRIYVGGSFDFGQAGTGSVSNMKGFVSELSLDLREVYRWEIRGPRTTRVLSLAASLNGFWVGGKTDAPDTHDPDRSAKSFIEFVSTSSRSIPIRSMR